MTVVHSKGRRYAQYTSKTITFDGTAGKGAVGAVPLFTVTGQVLVVALSPYCLVDLTEAAGGATLSLGVTGLTALFIAATNAVDIDAGEFWYDTTPDAYGVPVPAGLKDIAITASIVAQAAVQNVNGGSVRFDLYWLPLSPDGNVA